jgi:hypothetical protein
MSLEMARHRVDLGSKLLDILREVPDDWARLIPVREVERPEDVISFLAPHVYGGQHSDVSTLLDLFTLEDTDDREAHGFDDSLDEDPAYATTDEELAFTWREEIARRQEGKR